MKNSPALILIIGTLTIIVFLVFIVLILIEYRRRQVRHITEKLELKHKYNAEVLQTRIEVQEQAFRQFSEEVHDNIAQVLSLARLKLYKTAGKTTDETVKAGIETSNELLGKTLNDLRNLSHVLNGSLVAKIPLLESLEKELVYVNDSTNAKAVMSVVGEHYDLSAEKKLFIFRIIQEAIGNAIKHGQAGNIHIQLQYTPAMLTITITDNGKGFDTSLVNESKGLGLHNMQVRASMLGSMTLASELNKGTTLTLNVTTNG